MTIPSAAVIALRALSAQWRTQAKKSAEHAIVDAVKLPHAHHIYATAAMKLAECADDLDALLARVEPQADRLGLPKWFLTETSPPDHLPEHDPDCAIFRQDPWAPCSCGATARVEPPPSASVEQACGCVLFSQNGVVTRLNPCAQHTARVEPSPQE